MAKGNDDSGAVIIKKYANRRLYNTGTSSYVTLDDLCTMVKEGVDFVVHDAKSGEDLTRSVLTQIIFEQETKGENLLPVGFLRQLIGYYDDGLRALVPSYLEVAMENFADNQKQMRRNLESAFGDLLPDVVPGSGAKRRGRGVDPHGGGVITRLRERGVRERGH